MLLLHESLKVEARHVKLAIEGAFSVPVQLQSANLDSLFAPISEFEGYNNSATAVEHALVNAFPDTAVLLLTPRDIYHSNVSKDDDWILGYSLGAINVASTARMKRQDNLPSDELSVPLERYLHRIATLSVHEIGHHVAKAKHHKPAFYVNAKSGREFRLGPHCTDNTCVMYEVIDITTPDRAESYLLLGGKKCYDAGLDEQIDRMRPDWFCGPCKNSFVIGDEYRKRVEF